MDKRIINLILELSGWINQPLSSKFHDDGEEICELIRSVQQKLKEGEIGHWGNSTITKGLIANIYEICTNIHDISYELLTYIDYPSSELIHEGINLYNEYENLFNHYVEELKSIIEGIRNSNSF